MPEPAQLEYETAGIAVLLVVGAVSVPLAAVIAVPFPGVRASWVFVGLMGAVVVWPALAERWQNGATGADEGATDEAATGEGHLLDVALVDWANALVGTTCSRCEDEITYVPLGTTDGPSEHRIACGCTVIESTARS